MSVTAYETKFRALSRYATQLCFSPQEQIRRFVKGLRSELRISALQVAATATSFHEVVDFMIEVEGVKPDDFTMASTSKRFRKGGEFNGSYSRGQGAGGYPARPIQSSLVDCHELLHKMDIVEQFGVEFVTYHFQGNAKMWRRSYVECQPAQAPPMT